MALPSSSRARGRGWRPSIMMDLGRIHEIRASLGAARIERGWIGQLRAVLARQKQAVADADAVAYYETNAELHRLIAGHAGIPRLALMLGHLEGQMAIALRRISTSRAHMRAAYQEHGEIISHIRAKDGAKAEGATRSHIAPTLARVTKQRR